MKLTPEKRNALGRLVKERVGDFPPCAICQNPAGWTIAGSLVMAPALDGDQHAGPFVAMTCTKCGHTIFLHARVLGLVTPEASE